MRQLTRFVGATCAVVLGLLWTAAGVYGAETVPNDRRLPPEVVAYLDVRDVNQLKEKWHKTLLGQLLQEEELKAFWKELERPLADLSGQVESELGLPLKALLAVPQGEITIAVIQPPGRKLNVVALLNYGTQKETVQKLLERAEEALKDQDATRSEQEVEGTTITVYAQPADDDDRASESGSTVAWFLKDTTLAVGSGVEGLKSILTRWDGKQARVLAENEVYSYIMEKCGDGKSGAQPPISWYVDPIGLIKGVIASAGGVSPQTAMMMSFIPALGLDKLKAVGGTLDLATEEFDTITRTLVYVESPTSGVLKLFSFPATTQAPPKWVTADANTYFAINWDVASAYDAAGALYDMFAGPGALERLVDELARSNEGPKVHIKKDLIDQLTGSIQVAALPPAAESDDDEEAATDRYIFALGTKDEAALTKTLTAVSKTPGFPGEAREFQGTTLYEIPTPTGAAALAISRGHLLITTDVTLLESVLRSGNEQDALVDSDAYKRISKVFPAQTSSIGFQRSDAQIKGIYEALRSGQADQFLSDVEIDFSKLPAFEVIEPYLTPSGSYMVPDERGMFMMSFSLKGKANGK